MCLLVSLGSLVSPPSQKHACKSVGYVMLVIAPKSEYVCMVPCDSVSQPLTQCCLERHWIHADPDEDTVDIGNE